MMPLAITGVGFVGALGVGRQAALQALADPGAAELRAFSGTPTVLPAERSVAGTVAEAWGFDAKEFLGATGLRSLDRLTTFLITAARHALRDGRLKDDSGWLDVDPTRMGLCVSTAYGSLDDITELNRVSELESPRYINPARFPNTVINSAAGYVSIWEDLRGPNVTLVDGNCGALDAVHLADTQLRMRRADAFVVGGGEVLSEPLQLGLERLGLTGSGLVAGGAALRIGEGAALFCLEPLPAARQRGLRFSAMSNKSAMSNQGLKSWAEVCGYGTAFEPPASSARLVYSSPEVITRAIAAALSDAGLRPQDIDVVASAASGIEFFDAVELQAIQALFPQQVAVAAPKRIFGETFGAAGAMAMLASIAWFAGAPLGELVAGAPPPRFQHVLVLVVGYYGNASALVLRRPS